MKLTQWSSQDYNKSERNTKHGTNKISARTHTRIQTHRGNVKRGLGTGNFDIPILLSQLRWAVRLWWIRYTDDCISHPQRITKYSIRVFRRLGGLVVHPQIKNKKMNRHVVVQSLSTLSPFPSLNSRTSKCSINNSAHKRVFTGGGVIQELLATTTHEHDTYTHAQTKCGNSMEVSNQSQPKLQSSY